MLKSLLICYLLVSLPLCMSSGVSASLRLAHSGKSDYSIILSSEASASEHHASLELQRFLKEISGASIPIISEGESLPAHAILLGDSKSLRSVDSHIDLASLGDEGFVIETVGPNLVIAGSRLRGTMYGVYTFLEELLGCRWYSPYVSFVPKKKTISLKAMKIIQKPDFEYREPFYSGAFDGDWAARNRANGSHQQLDAEHGGRIIYGRFAHTLDGLLPVSAYYQEHPEYYALYEGKRTGGPDGQVCLSNPEVLQVATGNLLKWIAEKPDAKIWSVTQNDNFNHCQCPACKKIDDEEGSPSGTMLRFVNSVADEVGKKYPNVLIDTFAYQYTEKPPKITRPRPNVRVRLCPIFCCEHHTYEKCPENAAFMENLKGWSGITDCLYIWHYNTNFQNYLLPLPDFDELAADIPMYKRFGVKGVFMEGTYDAGYSQVGGAGFMDDLKAYLIAKLLWNSKADAKAITSDFLHGFYGNAAPAMQRYLDTLQVEARKPDVHGKIFDGLNGKLLTLEVMAKCNECFDEAERLAENPDVLSRVKHARLSIRYVEVMREAKSAATGTAEAKSSALKKLDQLVADCKSDGITGLQEWTSIDSTYQSLSKKLK